MPDILLCSDLDRTILPNGRQPESSRARPRLRRVGARQELTLAYVSGRSEGLLKAAIDEYDIPVPDYGIGDVGTTIYEPRRDWAPWKDWAEEIGRDWGGRTREELAALFENLSALRLQEPEKQNTFKLSYYTDAGADAKGLKAEMAERLSAEGVRASLIWSVDEQENVGLLDVLPERATKVHAIRFLMKKKGFSEDRTVFAGDSGNDLPALTSGLRAVLVRNARNDVRREARETMADKGLEDRLYLAGGGFLGMNGHYAAGVLEGLAHFLPETKDWMTAAEDG